MEAFADVEEHNNNSQLLSLAGTQVLLLQNGPLQFLLEFLLVSYYHTHDHLLLGGTHFQIWSHESHVHCPQFSILDWEM